MISENKVTIAGNLTREPELRYTPNNNAICEFNVAVTTKFKEGKEETAFINVVTWGKQAEYVGKYVSKGTNVYVTGRLIYESWEDKNGNKRNSLKVNAERVQSASPRKDYGDDGNSVRSNGNRQYPADDGRSRRYSDDVPQQQGRRQASQYAQSEESGVFQTNADDGIPF
jgi:single-strand DNA-binding protein